MSSADRPTLVYDGTVPWRDIGRGEQVLVDAIREHGAVVTVKAREAPYVEHCEVKSLARWDIHCEPGAVFGTDGKNVGRFTKDTPRPSDPPLGVLELYGFVQTAGNGVSFTRGLGLKMEDCDVSGIDLRRGGDTGVFSSHQGDTEKFIVLRRVKGRYHGSHNSYLDGTMCYVEDGEWHSADPARGDDRANQYDSFRSMTKILAMRGTRLFTTDPDPDIDPAQRGHSSMCLGAVSAQRAWYEDVTWERTGPPHRSARWIVGVRARQSFGGADRKYVGTTPAPDDQLISSLPGWAWFAPYLTDKDGKPVNESGGKAWVRNPRFFDPDYWRSARSAGIATAEQMFHNPHCFQQVFIRPTFINDGPQAVAVLGEGTQPVEPKAAHGRLHDPPKPRAEDWDQDDYLELPEDWFERSAIYVVEPTFRSDGDDGTFAKYVVRDASRFVPRRSSAALVTATGDGVANDTTVRIFEYAQAPAWLPAAVSLARMAHVFPEDARRMAQTIWTP